jgi:hypothetical protein
MEKSSNIKTYMVESKLENDLRRRPDILGSALFS